MHVLFVQWPILCTLLLFLHAWPNRPPHARGHISNVRACTQVSQRRHEQAQRHLRFLSFFPEYVHFAPSKNNEATRSKHETQRYHRSISTLTIPTACQSLGQADEKKRVKASNDSVVQMRECRLRVGGELKVREKRKVKRSIVPRLLAVFGSREGFNGSGERCKSR